MSYFQYKKVKVAKKKSGLNKVLKTIWYGPFVIYDIH